MRSLVRVKDDFVPVNAADVGSRGYSRNEIALAPACSSKSDWVTHPFGFRGDV